MKQTKQSYDLIIIGGGINGCALAADAAIKGLRVCLLEKNNLATGTSSQSSNLIHGGLRYLEQYDFKLVRDSLKEQAVWQQRAPHLVKPLAFILPHEKHLRPKWMIRIGLWIYDHLTGNKILPKTKKVNRTKNTYFSALKPHLTSGFKYYDCDTQGAAITVAHARLAQQYGANIITPANFQQAKLDNNQWHINYHDKQNNSHSISSKALVNMCGPWVEIVNQNISPTNTQTHIQQIKGSHIIVPKLYDGDHAYILQNKDNRIVFALPYDDKTTAIGTTDIVYNDDIETITINDDEKNYLCDLINTYFAKPITAKDIISSWSGVRALASSQSKTASEITREHHLLLDDNHGTPLLTLLGGKLTTSRSVAEEAMCLLKPYFSQAKSTSTKTIPLPGGDCKPDQLIPNLCTQYAFIEHQTIQRWVHQFGSETKTFLQNIHCIQDLGQHFGADLYQHEVDYLQQCYFAETTQDILFQLTRLQTALTATEQQQLQRYLQQNKPTNT